MIVPMALDERAFFSDRPETRPTRVTCNRCRRANEYSVRWVRRVKKDRLPGGADERDRAKFAKLRDHLIRVDDEVVCKSCGKKIEIPSLHSLLFVDQLEGLPRDVEEDELEAAAAAAPAPAAPAGSAPPPRAQNPSPRQQESRPQEPRQPERPGADQRPADRREMDRRGPRRMTTPRGWRG
jgi:ribosomal protein L12E/L44/L45/RPP1/RPP2